jgi:hypothetical protein
MTDHTARIAALEAALASGELTIKVEGKETTYRSTPELLQALRYFREQQATGAGYGVTLVTFGAD